MDDAPLTEFRQQVMALHRRLRQEHLGRVPLNELLVLGAADRLADAATPSAISVDLCIARPNVAALLRKLQAQDRVRLDPDPRDGRSVVVRLTPEGRRLLGHDRGRRDAWLRAAMDAELSPSEQQTVLRAGTLLKRLAGHRP